MINELEDELAETKLAMDEWVREKQQYQQYIENMQLEKEEMVRAHTIETGDLRKKVSVLTEHVQKMESTAMSTVPSSTGFTADYSDIDTLTMDGAWDSISFLNDFASDNDACIKPESAAPVTLSLTLPKKAEGSDDKPAAQGLLLMLLLCGAFVASKGITSTASAGLHDPPSGYLQGCRRRSWCLGVALQRLVRSIRSSPLRFRLVRREHHLHVRLRHRYILPHQLRRLARPAN